MRTIKFRGKASRKDKDMWLYGDLIKIGDSYHIVGKDDMREDGHHITQDSDIPTWVDEKTIGQFTGLLDKNGKEIYEGDYVEVSQGGFGGVVTWHLHGYFYIKEPYKFKYNEESDCLSLGEFTDNPKRKVTIVGNIHDNPELIKGK